MTERLEIIPLGGEPQGTDAGTTTPVTEIRNFITAVVNTVYGGSKPNLKFIKRRGYQYSFASTAATYLYSAALHWTGLAGTSFSPPSTARGVIVYTADKSGTDSKLFKFDGTETALGTFATADYRALGIQETLISGVPNLTIAMRQANSPYAQKLLFFPSGGALTEVTDVDFPASTFIGNPVHMDGFCFVATTTGDIYNSDVNSLSAWTSTSHIAAQVYSDPLVGMAKIRNLILGLGTRSIEFFNNQGNVSGSPLSRIDNAALKIGVLHQQAAQEIGNGLLFVSVSKDGIGVHFFDGQTAKKVSPVFIDNLLDQNADLQSNRPLSGGPQGDSLTGAVFFTGVIQMYGITYAVLFISNTMYAYAPAVDQWISLAMGLTTTNNYFFMSVGAQQIAVNRNIVGVNGNISYHPAGFTAVSTSGNDAADGGTQFTAYIKTAPLTWGTAKVKQYNSLRIIGDVQPVATPIVVSYSDDNGATFTTWGTIDMNVNPPVILTRGGASRRRIFKFSNTSAGGCVIDAVEAGIEVLAQ